MTEGAALLSVTVDAPVSHFIDIGAQTSVAVTEVTVVIESSAGQGATGAQGPVGIAGLSGAEQVDRRAAVALGGHRIVRASAIGFVNYAANTMPPGRAMPLGMTIGAALANAAVSVCTYGEITEPGWTWIVNKPVFLGIDGLMTQTPPVAPAALFSLVVGYAISSTTLFIKIGTPIILTL